MHKKIKKMLSCYPMVWEHSLNVFDIAKRLSISSNLRLSGEDYNKLVCAALFHDIGKSFWMSDWHTKPRYLLDTNTVTIMKLHPLKGASALAKMGIDTGIQQLVREHHERPGGTGYPLEIEPSYLSLVLAACDVFCACQEKRLYRKRPLTFQDTLKEIAKFAPPEIVNAFEDIEKENRQYNNVG